MTSTKKISISAVLIALGITIPMFMPKVTIPPASYTIASHVPVFVAMFISPSVAIAVTLGTAFGFFMTTPLVIALRALSHLVFAIMGSYYIQKNRDIINNKKQILMFNVAIGIIHATVECAVVALFYFFSPTGNNVDYFKVVFLMIGVGGFIHSLVDFSIAQVVVRKTSQI